VVHIVTTEIEKVKLINTWSVTVTSVSAQ
jgi:hypothetical protein